MLSISHAWRDTRFYFGGQSIGGLRGALAIAAGTNLLYHFPALFTILAIVPTRPALLGMPIDRAVFHQLLLDPETLSRVIHVWLASFAIGGMMLAWIGWHETRRKLQPSLEQAVASGGRLATVATLLQIPVGIWVLSTLPQEQQDRLLGDNSICTLLLGLSVLGSLALLHPLAMVALGERSTRRLAAATGLMVAVICMMTAALQCARS